MSSRIAKYTEMTETNASLASLPFFNVLLDPLAKLIVTPVEMNCELQR